MNGHSCCVITQSKKKQKNKTPTQVGTKLTSWASTTTRQRGKFAPQNTRIQTIRSTLEIFDDESMMLTANPGGCEDIYIYVYCIIYIVYYIYIMYYVYIYIYYIYIYSIYYIYIYYIYIYPMISPLNPT